MGEDLDPAIDAVSMRWQHAEDWQQARDLRLRMLATDPAAFGDTWAAAVARPASWWQQRATECPDRRTGVAIDADGIWQGSMTVVNLDTEPTVVAVWIAPQLRGRLVARQLFDLLRGHMLELGHDRIRLTVQETNRRGIGFWRTVGFVPTGRREPHPNDPPGGEELEFVLRDARPVLTTRRLRLVPLGHHHLADLTALDADPAVMRFLGDGRPRSAAEVASRMAGRTDPAAAARGLGYWSAFEAGAFVGWGLLMPTEVAGEAELGYRLRPEFWGRGLATEIGAALIDHGFSTVGLRTILAQTMAVNSGSRAVMAKLGMRHIRTFTWEGPEQPIPGSEHGEVEYRLDRDAATGR